MKKWNLTTPAAVSIVLLLCLQGDCAVGQSKGSSDKTSAWTLEYYQQLMESGGKKECRAIAEKMYSLGVATDDPGLQARGLVRLAYPEIRFGGWGNGWRRKLRECEELCGQKGTRAYAELLMFRGHLAKWRPKIPLSEGISDVKAAIVIASQIEDDLLLAEAHARLADLVLIEGHMSVCRSHALHALTIADHIGHSSAAGHALYLLTVSLRQDGQHDLALRYAKRLLEISPDDRLANDVVSKASDPEAYFQQQRRALREIPKAGLSMAQHNGVGAMYELFARNLLSRGEASEACEAFVLAARHFMAAGNNVNYVDSLLRSYIACLDNGAPITDAEPFQAMLEKPDLEYLPKNLEDIVRILVAMDRPRLAGKWREKFQLAKSKVVQTEHDRATAAAKQRLELELARRNLAKKIRAEQALVLAEQSLAQKEQAKARLEQAKAREEQASAWWVRLVFVTGFLLLGLVLFGCYFVANRNALIKLKQEVRVRELAQAKSEELGQQLLRTQKLDALGALSAGIAHDFNNTLQAVTMLTEMVKDGASGKSPEEAELLDSILEATQQGSTLTRGMLVFSGKHETAKSCNDLVTLARETETMVRHMVPAAITIKSEVLASNSVLVEMNDSQIKQVLLNLVINARDAMPEGGELCIRVSEAIASPEVALLTVSDTGGGMSDEVQARIFEPFFTTKDRGRGTGLGLSMAHGIVADHGGSIEVESESGVGTTIRVLLPRTVGRQQQVDEPRRQDFQTAGGVVLLVEDNEHIRLGIRTKLQRLGFRVQEAADGPSALVLYAEMVEQPSLIVMDIDLPGLNGRRCVETLREQGATAPVVFMTGLSSDQVVGPVLSKPFTEDDLVRAILDVQPGQNAKPATLT